MLREERAERIAYDAGRDEARVLTGLTQHGRIGRARDEVDLLLDASGYLVGVDLGGAGLERTVVMVGPHEAVASTQKAVVEIARDAAGQVAEVVITSAATSIRARDRNPYILRY